MTIPYGTRLGRYEIRSKIGAGGMGEVYLAQDTKLDRKVALKILPALDSLHKIVHAPTPQISHINPAAPAELQRIVRRCLAKDREDRYQTIKDVAIEVRELRRELASGAGVEDTASPTGRSSVPPAGARRGDARSFPTEGSTSSLTDPSSSAEYILTGINQHKLAVVMVALVLAFGVVGLVERQRKYEERKIFSRTMWKSRQESDASIPFLEREPKRRKYSMS